MEVFTSGGGGGCERKRRWLDCSDRKRERLKEDEDDIFGDER